MRILFLGDVVGKAGREAVSLYLPEIKRQLKPDFTIVNGENAANGFGINEKIVKEITLAGANAITTGDHTFDQKETKFFINQYKNLLRPHNMPEQLPGKGVEVFDIPTRTGKKIVVIHVMGQVFMRFTPNCPFEAVGKILQKYKLGVNADYIFVDFHAEATSEKMAMGHFCDGRVTAVVGTHTHVPTGDVMVMRNGTGYMTDAGMCGDYDSVIGFQPETAVPTFTNKIREDKFRTSEGAGSISGFFVVADEKTGLAERVDYVRMGGQLKQHIPQI
jgi:metallophosphoesterase (TIGR00282 family)